MLKIRVIPTLLHKDFGLVKGVRFDSLAPRSAARCRRSRSTTCATSTSSCSST